MELVEANEEGVGCEYAFVCTCFYVLSETMNLICSGSPPCPDSGCSRECMYVRSACFVCIVCVCGGSFVRSRKVRRECGGKGRGSFSLLGGCG